MESIQAIHTPKQNPRTKQGRSGWYGYYAGYSPAFVRDMLTHFGLSPDATVMDPWNGSGTTTHIAHEMGLRAIGFDINPVMVIVAKARSLDAGVRPSIESLAKEIAEKARRYNRMKELMQNDEPLNCWFTTASSYSFRSIDWAIQDLLMSNLEHVNLYHLGSYQSISTLAGFFYTALFRALRIAVRPFIGSNPTWIKVPSDNHRLAIEIDTILASFLLQCSDMAHLLEPMQEHSKGAPTVVPSLEIASSLNLPITDQCIDAIVSSPPYCTRIDYAIATKPELALMGCSMEKEILDLRRQMIGTPTMRKDPLSAGSKWGDTCNTLLQNVKEHASYASSIYYYRNFLQYFDSMYQSLEEIKRVLKPTGYCAMVVQDSYYKELNIDLPTIFSEMGQSMGLDIERRVDFRVPVTMAKLNKGANKYRKVDQAVESILVLGNH